MVRTYVILAAALVGIGALVGVTRLTQSSDATAVAVASEPSVAPAATADLAPAVRTEPGSDVQVAVEPVCTLSQPLIRGDEHDDVVCLESQLVDAGLLAGTAPDTVFDDATDAAVRAFQRRTGLVVDGVVGSKTASRLGTWAGPGAHPPDPDTCPDQGRAAAIDRFNQRAWLCEDGAVAEVVPMTSALSQPDPGSYDVYAKELVGSSSIDGEYSEMTHFVAFSHGENRGARIAFHSVPTYPGGGYVQPLDSVGAAEQHGASAGCIRLLPDDAERIWNWLDVGDRVLVVT